MFVLLMMMQHEIDMLLVRIYMSSCDRGKKCYLRNICYIYK